jgi:type IV pilus assembly protein PilE
MNTVSAPIPRPSGFTLLELMISLAVVGILVGIAYPSYQGNVRKSRRSDAADAATAVLQAEESWRANNATYGTLANINVSATSGGGYYGLALSAVSGTGYTLSFTPVSGKGQSSDTGCTAMTVTVANGSPTYAPAACWSR